MTTFSPKSSMFSTKYSNINIDIYTDPRKDTYEKVKKSKIRKPVVTVARKLQDGKAIPALPTWHDLEFNHKHYHTKKKNVWTDYYIMIITKISTILIKMLKILTEWKNIRVLQIKCFTMIMINYNNNYRTG